MNEMKSHEVVWDKEKLGRFWDFFSSLGVAYEDEYFSNVWGENILNYVTQTGPIEEGLWTLGADPGTSWRN